MGRATGGNDWQGRRAAVGGHETKALPHATFQLSTRKQNQETPRPRAWAKPAHLLDKLHARQVHVVIGVGLQHIPVVDALGLDYWVVDQLRAAPAV